MRKDLAVGQLMGIQEQLGMVAFNTYQMVTSVVLVSLYFPCVATIAMIIKEGMQDRGKGVITFLLGSLAVLMAVVFIWGGLLHLIWIILGVA